MISPLDTSTFLVPYPTASAQLLLNGCLHARRTFLPLVRERVAFLVQILKQHGPGAPTNIDDLLLRLSMDVTGLIQLLQTDDVQTCMLA
jgi:hypothetical protein